MLYRAAAAAAALLSSLATAGCLGHAQPAAAPTAVGATVRATASATGSAPTTETTATASTTAAASSEQATAATPSRPSNPWTPYTAPRASWEAWRPRVSDVREAGGADLAALEARARAAQGHDYTTTVETFFGPSEFSHTRTHDRLRIGDAPEWAFEVHVEPFRAGDKGDGAFGMTRRAAVVCGHQECVRVTGAENPAGRPHLFDNLTDSALMQAAILVGLQESAVDLLHHFARKGGFAIGTARVASPIGPLDCVVAAATPSDLLAMEGQDWQIDSSGDPEAALACLDARGLVVLTTDRAFPVVAYQAFRPGTAPDLRHYPHPVKAYSS